MADVFISYAREDRARAAQIAEGLQAGGYDVFWDVEIPPGATWANVLEEKLSNCKAAIVLWSKVSTASEWVREEARVAKGRTRLIPVQLDETPPPFGFGEIQAANLTSWNGAADDPHWKQLLASVASAVGAAPRGTASAKPIKTGGGWDAGKAAGGSADDKKKKPNIPLIIGGAVIGTVVVLAIIGSMMDTGTTPPQAVVSNGGTGADVSALSPAVQGAVQQARAAQAAGRAASERASAAAVEANRAALQASQGVGGFGQVQIDPVTTVMGDLTALQQGRAGAVVMKNTQLGTTFTGALELDPSTGLMRRLLGAFDNGRGGTGLGELLLNGQQGQSAGRDTSPLYTAEGQGQGIAGSFESSAMGVVTFADGRRYEGQYITRGREANLLRHGLGVSYGADGQVQEAGRFDNDRFVGPS
jgi:hypothetical protein